MFISIRVLFSQPDMWIVNSPDFANFRSLCLSHVFEINNTSGYFEFKFRELTLIVIVLVETIIVHHASDISMVFELFLIWALKLPDPAKILHICQVFAPKFFDHATSYFVHGLVLTLVDFIGIWFEEVVLIVIAWLIHFNR